MIDPLVHISVRGVLLVIICVAVAHKLRDVRGFQAAVNGYGVLPGELVPIAALLVLAAEFFVAAMLAFGGAVMAGVSAACLFGGYAILIGVKIAQGKTAINCGCSWVKAASLSPAYCYRNGVLAALGLLLLASTSDRSLLIFDFINAAFFAAVMAGVYFLFDALLHMRNLGVKQW